MTVSGPGKPPKHTQFQKGQSGNPRGRPTKADAKERRSAFDVIVAKTLQMMQNGAPQEVSVEEALQHKTYQEAIAGNRSARSEVLRMILQREQALAKQATPVERPIEMVSEHDPDKAN